MAADHARENTMLDESLDAAALRDLYGEPSELAARKVLTRLDGHCRRFIELSPFLVLGTSDAQGRQDVSPRGDRPGFVRVLGERVLLVPDRPGNRRVDSLANVVEHPEVGMLFLIPGVDETLRVNGRGRVTRDTALLEPSAVNGRVPVSGLLVEVREAFLHCGKALIRARLWDPASRIERKALPTLGRMIADQIAGVELERAEEAVATSYRDTLY